MSYLDRLESAASRFDAHLLECEACKAYDRLCDEGIVLILKVVDYMANPTLGDERNVA